MTIHEAAVEWVSLFIQRRRPIYRQVALVGPGGEILRAQLMAEDLLNIAEEYTVPVEEILAWVERTPEKQFTRANFERVAKRYYQTVFKLRRPTSNPG